MADEDQDTADRALYVLKGSKRQGEKIGRLIVEGSTQNPIRFADLDGEPVALTADEHKLYAKDYKLTKQGDESEREAAGADDEGTTPKQQQASQAATAAPGAQTTTRSTGGKK